MLKRSHILYLASVEMDSGPSKHSEEMLYGSCDSNQPVWLLSLVHNKDLGLTTKGA